MTYDVWNLSVKSWTSEIPKLYATLKLQKITDGACFGQKLDILNTRDYWSKINWPIFTIFKTTLKDFVNNANVKLLLQEMCMNLTTPNLHKSSNATKTNSVNLWWFDMNVNSSQFVSFD